jgi:hypothetical protein
MAYTTVFNPFTKKLDYVGSAAPDTTPGGTANVWLLEDGLGGWLLEDGTGYWLLQ